MTLPAVALLMVAATDASYVEDVEQWRQDREARLRAPYGWLSLAGLSWLKEGPNVAGSGAGVSVELPAGTPGISGTFHRQGHRVTWQPRGGEPRPMRTDKNGEPDVVQIGNVQLTIIERGARLGVRVRDPQSTFRRGFKGLIWYPVDRRWRVRARFVPLKRSIRFAVQAGDPQVMDSPGYVEWTSGGRRLRLTPVLEGQQLWWVFRDRTSGRTTYPAARFLYSDMPKDGFVELDFNKSYNPPCVFTPYATCPLPPPENRLPVSIEAGEKIPPGH
ncbi:MAG TPA: DUF1684 domain-containing protein [Bryobacteraceae bacterium]|nr:DUF1684 domain-containing protein [Bryobacteraceae bacterium]